MRGLPQKNLAVEMLRRLLTDEIKTRSKYVVQSRLLSDMLEKAIRKYQNRSVEAAQVIAELIDLAKDYEIRREAREDLG